MAQVDLTIRRMFVCDHCKGYGRMWFRDDTDSDYTTSEKCPFCNGRSAEIEFSLAIHNGTCWWMTWPQPDPSWRNPREVGQN